MADNYIPSEEDLQYDEKQILAEFSLWQTGDYTTDEFIRMHWQVCQYFAMSNRTGRCPHPDIGNDRMRADIVSAVRITAVLLQKDVSCQTSVACFVAHVLASVPVVLESAQ